MNNKYNINRLRVQQFGLTATILDDSGKEHYFYRGHEYVEIGGLKWAVTNIGANTETDRGLYFAFGETKGYTVEQIRSGERRFTPNEYTNTNFDSVKAYWGGKWRLPTADEFRVLLHSTTNEWVYNYQGSRVVSGRLFTDKTDSSKKLFFPSVGYCYNSTVELEGITSYYWSSSLVNEPYKNNCAKSLDFYKYSECRIGLSCGIFGLPIRGIVG